MQLDPKLAGQGIGRALGNDGQTHDQRQVFGTPGRLEDLLQLLVAVQREGIHAVTKVGSGDGLAALDRVHEGHAGAWRMRSHELDLRDRGHIEGRHTVRGQGLDDPWGRVRFHSVEDVAFKLVLEPARRYRHRIRPRKGDRTFG